MLIVSVLAITQRMQNHSGEDILHCTSMVLSESMLGTAPTFNYQFQDPTSGWLARTFGIAPQYWLVSCPASLSHVEKRLGTGLTRAL